MEHVDRVQKRRGSHEVWSRPLLWNGGNQAERGFNKVTAKVHEGEIGVGILLADSHVHVTVGKRIFIPLSCQLKLIGWGSTAVDAAAKLRVSYMVRSQRSAPE